MSMHKSTNVSYRTEEIVFPARESKSTTYAPQEIVEYLNRNVIGQEQAKKTLALAVYNHMQRINRRQRQTYIPKSNIILQGSTGSGKTFILKNLAKLINVPLVICDASSLTEAGYKGRNAETILEDLFYVANQNIDMAQRGIVYLDEFDKLAGGAVNERGSGAVMGASVQRQILKMIEGCEMSIVLTNRKRITINTENILFICGGAFVGMKNKENTKEKKRLIGFRADPYLPEEKSEKKKLSHQDFIDYGLIPELVGRLPVIVELNTLTEADLVNILMDSESSILRGYQNTLKDENVDLVFEEEAVKEIAHIAYSENTGARGLNAVIDRVMEDVMFEIPSDPSISRCVITREAVCGKTAPVLETRASLYKKLYSKFS